MLDESAVGDVDFVWEGHFDAVGGMESGKGEFWSGLNGRKDKQWVLS